MKEVTSMGCFEARMWLQQFWDRHGRLPQTQEVPIEHSRYLRGFKVVPVGWEFELRLASALADLGLYVYPYSPEQDRQGVDISFELGDYIVDLQLKACRPYLNVELLGWHWRSPYVLVEAPYRGGELLTAEVEAIVGRLLRLLDLDYTVVPAWAPKTVLCRSCRSYRRSR
jgi:hypothetical protein